MADYNYENREKYKVSILLLLLLLFIIFDNDAIIMQSEGIKQLKIKKNGELELVCFDVAMKEAEDLKKMRVAKGISYSRKDSINMHTHTILHTTP